MKWIKKWLVVLPAALAPALPVLELIVRARLVPPALVAALCAVFLLAGLPFKPCEWLLSPQQCNDLQSP